MTDPSATGPGWVRYGEGRFTFGPARGGVVVNLKACRRHDGHIYGDVEAGKQRDDGGFQKLLVRPNVNLTSTQSLKALAGVMTKQIPIIDADGRADEEWSTSVTEYVCATLVDQFNSRLVQSVLTPMTGAALAQPMAFAEFIPSGVVTGITAHGGVGKSMSADVSSLAMALGVKVGCFDPLGKGPVLYLDWENSSDMHRRRMTRLCMGTGLPFPEGRIHHIEAAGVPLLQCLDELLEIQQRVKAILVIFDSIGFAAATNLNNSEAGTAIMSAIKQFKHTKLAIAHSNKASALEEKAGVAGPSGSTFFWNGAQAYYDLTMTEESMGSSTQEFVFTNTKFNVMRKRGAIGMTLEFVDPDGPIYPEEFEVTNNTASGRKVLTPTQRVMDILRAAYGPVSTTALEQELGVEKGGMRKLLGGLAASGTIVQVYQGGGRGNAATWGLAARKEPKPRAGTQRMTELDAEPPRETLGVCYACSTEAEHMSTRGRWCCPLHMVEDEAPATPPDEGDSLPE